MANIIIACLWQCDYPQPQVVCSFWAPERFWLSKQTEFTPERWQTPNVYIQMGK